MSEMKEKALQQLNGALEEHFTNMEEAEKFLSERFEDSYALLDEAQLAFDAVNDETNGILGQYFVYTLSADGETWYVGTGDEFDADNVADYIEAFENHYGGNFASLDECTSKLEHHVMKDMSNAGCDAHSALTMIVEEDLGLPGVFAILGADADPRIEWANFDKI